MHSSPPAACPYPSAAMLGQDRLRLEFSDILQLKQIARVTKTNVVLFVA